jgi:hypothetical protein
VLWRNDNGQVALWLMNGTNLLGGGVVGPGSASTDWAVAGSGDFNGDVRDDILWRNDNGQIATWLLNGTNLIGGGLVGPGSATTRRTGPTHEPSTGSVRSRMPSSSSRTVLWPNHVTPSDSAS